MATAQKTLLCSLPRNTRAFITFYVVFAVIFQVIVPSAGNEDNEYDLGVEGSGSGAETAHVHRPTLKPLLETKTSTPAIDNMTFEDEQSSSTVRYDPVNTTIQSRDIENAALATENVTIPGPTVTNAKCGSIGGPEKNPYFIGTSIGLILLIVQYFMH